MVTHLMLMLKVHLYFLEVMLAFSNCQPIILLLTFENTIATAQMTFVRSLENYTNKQLIIYKFKLTLFFISCNSSTSIIL
jgi:hypothetical protein